MIEILRRMELLYFFRDLFKIKSLGKLFWGTNPNTVYIYSYLGYRNGTWTILHCLLRVESISTVGFWCTDLILSRNYTSKRSTHTKQIWNQRKRSYSHGLKICCVIQWYYSSSGHHLCPYSIIIIGWWYSIPEQRLQGH